MIRLDLSEILELASKYYDGMVSGSASSLEQVFETGARFQGVRDGEQLRRGLAEFLTMVATPTSGRTDASDYSVTVELVDVTGPVALIKLKDRFRGRTYVDYLTAVKTPIGWRIVNKAFVTVD